MQFKKPSRFLLYISGDNLRIKKITDNWEQIKFSSDDTYIEGYYRINLNSSQNLYDTCDNPQITNIITQIKSLAELNKLLTKSKEEILDIIFNDEEVKNA